MKELLAQIQPWTVEKKKVALARVIQTWGSSPRPVGSAMFISEDMEMVGSVSGGCVEGAVLKEAKAIMSTGKAKLVQYGVSDEDAWVVGLSCGGKLHVYIQPWISNDASSDIPDRLHHLMAENKSCIMVTTLTEDNQNTLVMPDGTCSGSIVPQEVVNKSVEAYEQRKHDLITIGDIPYFIQVFPRRSQMIIIGAAHITADLVSFAHQFDFETIVIDPRGTFAKNTTFVVKPDQIFEKYPSEVLNDLPLDPNTYAVILSHDPKIDDDALQILLKKNVAYIGALGSKKNHEKRTKRLLEKGFTADEIARIEAPIGLDIHAKGAKEIALSILAAVINVKNLYV